MTSSVCYSKFSSGSQAAIPQDFRMNAIRIQNNTSEAMKVEIVFYHPGTKKIADSFTVDLAPNSTFHSNLSGYEIKKPIYGASIYKSNIDIKLIQYGVMGPYIGYLKHEIYPWK